MNGPASKSRAGFTLVEVLIGSTLAFVILLGVISSYAFLGRNFARLTNQQLLEAQGRRTVAYFIQDVRMASGISGTPSASGMTLTLPTSSGSTTVTYTYDSTGQTLSRTRSGGPTLTLLTNLQSFSFSYYDTSDQPYTSFADYLIGIKLVAMTFTSQIGSSANGTRTPVYQGASPRLLVRNKQLLQ